MSSTAEAQKIDPLEQLRYPIGKFEWGKEYSEEEIQKMIKTLDGFPARLKKVVAGLKKEQLDTPYRDGGWTIRQVVHHVFDSHANAYMRFKLALTEDNPTIKPYDQKAWAELEDATLPPLVSLTLIANLHKRWTTILKSMRPEDFERTFIHPEHNRQFNLKEILALYAWHSNHHYEHINQLKKRKKW